MNTADDFAKVTRLYLALVPWATKVADAPIAFSVARHLAEHDLRALSAFHITAIRGIA